MGWMATLAALVNSNPAVQQALLASGKIIRSWACIFFLVARCVSDLQGKMTVWKCSQGLAISGCPPLRGGLTLPGADALVMQVTSI